VFPLKFVADTTAQAHLLNFQLGYATTLLSAMGVAPAMSAAIWGFIAESIYNFVMEGNRTSLYCTVIEHGKIKGVDS